MSDPVLEALHEALQRDPHNGPLWLHYAELLERGGRARDALAALRTALTLPGVQHDAERRMIPLLRQLGELAEALIRAERLLAAREDAMLREELRLIERARGAEPEGGGGEAAAASVRGDAVSEAEWAAQFDWGDLRVTLADVAGLAAVKRQIELRILAPYRSPEIYEAFGREGGGGLLLYGPPGCGKTFVARATAGELGARFLAVGIHDVLDKFWGESEKAIHAIFQHAREKSPTVLFFDEFDALGASRTRGESQFYKTLVDQLLQEMDGFARRNRDVLLFAATNAPWNVDAAFRRPGRFDHVLFVPPPDAEARRMLLRTHTAKLPGAEGLTLDELVTRTELFTGADLKALCERAAEAALERSLALGQVQPVKAADFGNAARAARSTALEWLGTARNHAKYANAGGQYDELEAFLKRVKRW
jgi:SpoVK/Ycf46/Vps4 family AAA+-type ATPase